MIAEIEVWLPCSAPSCHEENMDVFMENMDVFMENNQRKE
jgi:hypothetical protein